MKLRKRKRCEGCGKPCMELTDENNRCEKCIHARYYDVWRREVPGGTQEMRMMVREIMAGVLLIVMVTGGASTVRAEQPDFNKLCQAIYHAEGGAKTRHPYGIMAKYKHTTPLQACLNTVKHKYRDWEDSGSEGSYMQFLASKYAPVEASNDPEGLNKNWLRNVETIYGAMS